MKKPELFKFLSLCRNNPILVEDWRHHRPCQLREIFWLMAKIKYKQPPGVIPAVINDFFKLFTETQIKNVEDILWLLRGYTDNIHIDHFLQEFVENAGISDQLALKMVRSRKLLVITRGHYNWLDRPLRVHVCHLLSRAGQRKYSYQQLIPVDLKGAHFLIEYVLSWAFEEDKLSRKGILIFKDMFPKKYQQLLIIKNYSCFPALITQRLHHPNPVKSLRQLLITLKKQGLSKQKIMQGLHQYMSRLSGKDHQMTIDLLGDILDMVTGW